MKSKILTSGSKVYLHTTLKYRHTRRSICICGYVSDRMIYIGHSILNPMDESEANREENKKSSIELAENIAYGRASKLTSSLTLLCFGVDTAKLILTEKVVLSILNELIYTLIIPNISEIAPFLIAENNKLIDIKNKLKANKENNEKNVNSVTEAVSE